MTAGLWNLEEGASTLMHVKMYELLAGGSEPLEAHGAAVSWLRHARRAELLDFMHDQVDPNFDRARLQDHGERPYESPSDWAAFTFIGH